MKRLFLYFNHISDAAFCLLAGTLKTCCTMVFCAFLLLVDIESLTPHTYQLYRLALELTLSPVGVLLVGGLCSIIVEDHFGT